MISVNCAVNIVLFIIIILFLLNLVRGKEYFTSLNEKSSSFITKYMPYLQNIFNFKGKEKFTSNNNTQTEYITKNKQIFTKTTHQTCDILTSPITFPVGTTEMEALEICSQTSNLGGHGQCIGILPFNKKINPNASDEVVYPWIGCLSTTCYATEPTEGTWLNLENENVNNYQFA